MDLPILNVLRKILSRSFRGPIRQHNFPRKGHGMSLSFWVILMVSHKIDQESWFNWTSLQRAEHRRYNKCYSLRQWCCKASTVQYFFEKPGAMFFPIWGWGGSSDFLSSFWHTHSPTDTFPLVLWPQLGLASGPCASCHGPYHPSIQAQGEPESFWKPEPWIVFLTPFALFR